MSFKLARFALPICCFALIHSGCHQTNKIANSNRTSLFQQMAQQSSDKNVVKVPPNLIQKNRSGRKPLTAFWKKNVSVEEAAKSRKLKNPRQLHLKYAALLEQMGKYDEARTSYGNVLKEDPKFVDAVLGMARVDLLAGKTGIAEREYQKAIEMKPNDAHVRASFAQFLVTQKRWTKAVSEMQAATSLDPDNQEYQFALGVALAHADRIGEAFPLLSKTVGEAEAHYNIGYIYFQNKEFERANSQFQQALMLKPELEQASAMQQEIIRLTQVKSPQQSQIHQAGYERPSLLPSQEISLNPGIRLANPQQVQLSDIEELSQDEASGYIGHSQPKKR